jgi:hypothetical protein
VAEITVQFPRTMGRNEVPALSAVTYALMPE